MRFSERILSAYPEDRIRGKAVCLSQIRQALADGVDAKDLEEAVRAYAIESEGFTRSKVCFSDNWFTSGRVLLRRLQSSLHHSWRRVRHPLVC